MSIERTINNWTEQVAPIRFGQTDTETENRLRFSSGIKFGMEVQQP